MKPLQIFLKGKSDHVLLLHTIPKPLPGLQTVKSDYKLVTCLPILFCTVSASSTLGYLPALDHAEFMLLPFRPAFPNPSAWNALTTYALDLLPHFL